MAPRARRAPSFLAAAGPEFFASATTDTPMPAAWEAVASVEPSSTTMISQSAGAADQSASRQRRRSPGSLWTGTMTEMQVSATATPASDLPPPQVSSAARYPRDGWWIEWPCTRHSGGLPPSTQRSKFHTQGVFNEPLSGSTASRRPCGRWPKGCSGARKGAHPRPPAQSIRSGSAIFHRRVRHVTAFVLVALLCAAASVVHAEPVCSSDGWCWSNPLPQGNPLTSVWGSASTDVWAVGYGGTILHWDGSAWAGVPSGTPNTLYGVWGGGRTDGWAAGGAGQARAVGGAGVEGAGTVLRCGGHAGAAVSTRG